MSASAYVEGLEGRRLFSVPSGFTEARVGPTIASTTTMTLVPDGRIFVAQQDGRLRVIRDGQLLSTPFFQLTVDSTGERGLLAVTIDPQFATNGYVYAGYTLKTPDGKTRNRISRFTASTTNPDTAEPGSEVVLLDLDPVGTSPYHNIGSLHFGIDGKLYASVGENFTSSYAQNMGNLFGKMLRINPDGTIPEDNPFYARTSGRNRAMWAIGLRNPFSFAIQPGTGRMFINDVGISSYEEINEGQAGANYGWPATQGPTTNPAYTTPFYADPHENVPDYALAGGAFYNPPFESFPADYVGDYFFGNWGTGVIDRLDTATKTVTRFANNVDRIVDIDVADDGSLYYLLQHKGVFRVQSTTSVAPVIRTHPDDEMVAEGLPASFSVSASGQDLSYQWQRNGVDVEGATGSTFTIDPVTLADGGHQFAVVVSNPAGSVTSNTATLTVLDEDLPTAAIVNPVVDTTYAGGTTISFDGTGFDAVDGDLPDAAFRWEVLFHHNTHHHPGAGPFTGVKSGSFDVPNTGETSDNVWYRIHLTVTDSVGLKHSVYRDVHPQKAQLGLATNVPGMSLTLDGAPVDAPFSTTAVAGMVRNIGALPTQTVGGVQYEFVGWSDGGELAHDVTTATVDTVYTATYAPVPPTTLALAPVADGYVRNGTYAATNYGDAPELEVKRSAATGNSREAYLRFDLTGVGGVASAKLRWFARLGRDTLPTVVARVFAVANTTWDEATLNWNNKPAVGAALGDVGVSGVAGQWYELDVTNYVRGRRLAGAGAVSFGLKGPTVADPWIIMGSAEGVGAPELFIEQAEETPAGRAVVGPAADAYVRGGKSAALNFGNDGLLLVKKATDASLARESYLRFDLATLPTIGTATLRLFGRLNDRTAPAVDVQLHAVSDTTWSESTLTWSAKPAAGVALGARRTVTGTAWTWYEWDVTAYLQERRLAGATAVSFALKAPAAASPLIQFNSSEAALDGPELLVTYG